MSTKPTWNLSFDPKSLLALYAVCVAEKKSSKNSPNFTVKNRFTAKNTGQLPFYIKGFSVNDRPCEGYGFKVLECEGFELAPNASRVLNIAWVYFLMYRDKFIVQSPLPLTILRLTCKPNHVPLSSCFAFKVVQYFCLVSYMLFFFQYECK